MPFYPLISAPSNAIDSVIFFMKSEGIKEEIRENEGKKQSQEETRPDTWLPQLHAIFEVTNHSGRSYDVQK